MYQACVFTEVRFTAGVVAPASSAFKYQPKGTFKKNYRFVSVTYEFFTESQANLSPSSVLETTGNDRNVS